MHECTVVLIFHALPVNSQTSLLSVLEAAGQRETPRPAIAGNLLSFVARVVPLCSMGFQRLFLLPRRECCCVLRLGATRPAHSSLKCCSKIWLRCGPVCAYREALHVLALCVLIPKAVYVLTLQPCMCLP